MAHYFYINFIKCIFIIITGPDGQISSPAKCVLWSCKGSFCAAVGRGLLEGDTPLQSQDGTSLPSLLMQYEWAVCISWSFCGTWGFLMFLSWRMNAKAVPQVLQLVVRFQYAFSLGRVMH